MTVKIIGKEQVVQCDYHQCPVELKTEVSWIKWTSHARKVAIANGWVVALDESPSSRGDFCPDCLLKAVTGDGRH